jgi:hypothetical protein
MSDYIKFLHACLDEAPRDEGAAGVLREIMHSAADAAPVDALVEVMRTMVELRERDLRRFLQRN